MRGNLLPPLHGLLFSISSKRSFKYTIPNSTAHTMVIVITVMEHWLEQKIAQWDHHEESI